MYDRMNQLTKTILTNAHPASLILATGAVLGGLNASIIRGEIAVFPSIMTLIFALLLQIAANLYHGYLDLRSGAGENITGMNDRGARSFNSSKVQLMKIVANGVGLLALTAGLPLFAYVGWVGLLYVAVIVILLYFYFLGPRPAVRTQWSLLYTFLLFGPVAVSGTAFIQNHSLECLLPIVVYSIMTGLLSVNAHIAVEYLCYKHDLMNGKETLVTMHGGEITRYVYMADSILVSLLLILRPSTFENVSPWIGLIVGIALLLTSEWAFRLMKEEPGKVSRKIRTITMYQCIVIMVVLMGVVVYSLDFDFNVFDMS